MAKTYCTLSILASFFMGVSAPLNMKSAKLLNPTRMNGEHFMDAEKKQRVLHYSGP
jgi:hypothetical protein